MTLSPETYFIIKYKVDKDEFMCGPYSEIGHATTVLVNHIPVIAALKSKKKKYNYMAEVQECILDREGKWKTIKTTITENLCRRMKK